MTRLAKIGNMVIDLDLVRRGHYEKAGYASVSGMSVGMDIYVIEWQEGFLYFPGEEGKQAEADLLKALSPS